MFESCKRVMQTSTFPLPEFAAAGSSAPGSSYKELTKIIMGYGQLKGAGSPADVSKVATVDPTQVSRSNKFLAFLGLIAGGQKKAPTDTGRVLAHALEHDLPDEVVAAWQACLDGNEFIDKVLSAVRIRKGMERGSLQAHASEKRSSVI